MQESEQKNFKVNFFETAAGRQPVKEFLLELTKEDRKEVGGDIRVVEIDVAVERLNEFKRMQR